MRSMTGYGVGDAPLQTGRLVVEIRSVNHRFLDVRVRAGHRFADLAPLVESFAREKFARGRLDILVRGEGGVGGGGTIDRERARAAWRELSALRDEIAPNQELPLSLLATVPDLFVSPVDELREEARAAARTAFDAAALALDAMRAREGAALREDLVTRLAALREIAAGIAARAPALVELHRKKLLERAERLKLAQELHADSARLEQEIALFAERVDIAEELTRLESHCDQFETMLKAGGSIGRRLDFLLQELAREANTMGAKSPDAQVSHAIVEAKAEIERMREQVQNVE
jgi:uncharacterized protein (TIGR00255 family)